MISLLSPILISPTSVSLGTPGNHLFPRDCTYHIMQFTDKTTTLSMFLVCRSWYHAEYRFLMLADTFYYFPERFREDIIRVQFIPMCASSSLSTMKGDVRWGSIEALLLKGLDTIDGTETETVCFFPP
eukprot:PhF_6_TR42100/c0_g1_i3/m.63552